MTCCADAGLTGSDRSNKATAPSNIVGFAMAIFPDLQIAIPTAIDRRRSLTN
jgi:hypothetical protein